MNSFGDRLRARRNALGLTQDELAERVQVSKSAISSWENNRDTPTFEKLVVLRGALETSLDHLMCGDGDVQRLARQANRIAESGIGAYQAANWEALSRDEMRLMRKFRAMNERRQRAVLTMLDPE